MKNKQKHLIVRSRNFTCKELRKILVSHTTILRLGSTTRTEDITKCKNPIEINTAEACRISGNKLLMKKAFDKAGIKTPEWLHFTKNITEETIVNVLKSRIGHEWKYIICKHKNSSKGRGLYLLKSSEDIKLFLHEHYNTISNYIFERYYNYAREYRVHVTKDGIFYACRKMLKNDAEERWHRHDHNCVWITETNEKFCRPINWNDIEKECIRALKSIGLDIAAFDIKVSNKGDYPEFMILESNSAPGLGALGLTKYKQIIESWT